MTLETKGSVDYSLRGSVDLFRPHPPSIRVLNRNDGTLREQKVTWIKSKNIYSTTTTTTAI